MKLIFHLRALSDNHTHSNDHGHSIYTMGRINIENSLYNVHPNLQLPAPRYKQTANKILVDKYKLKIVVCRNFYNHQFSLPHEKLVMIVQQLQRLVNININLSMFMFQFVHVSFNYRNSLELLAVALIS